MLKPGDSAPDLTLTLVGGESISLRAPGSKLLLFFFPKAFSPVCTKEACSFRDAAPRFEGAKVIGVSRDPENELTRFGEVNHLGYGLFSDSDGALHKAFGALLFGALPRRATFLISEDGTILKAYVNDLGSSSHVSAMC